MNQFFSINWFGSMNWAMSMNCFFLMNWPLSAQDLEPNIELRHERMGRTEDVRVRYLQDLCRLWPPAKKVMEAKKLPAPQLHEKGRLMADLDRANIVKPEVPPSTRYPPDRKPPSKKKRSDANQLEEDKAWYLAGAVHPEFGRLRSAKLSDKVAVSYWNRFCLFVAFVDYFRCVWVCLGLPQRRACRGLLLPFGLRRPQKGRPSGACFFGLAGHSQAHLQLHGRLLRLAPHGRPAMGCLQ